jgi:hypothetical protein
MNVAQGGGTTVYTRVVFHGKNHWYVKENRAGASPGGCEDITLAFLDARGLL